MKMAVLGGTFNPVHYGHLNIAEQVWEKMEYDRILLIPAYMPAHKDLDSWIDPMHRIGMLQAVVESTSYLLVEACEIKRKGISYTIDTIFHLMEKYTIDGKPGLIIGDDLLDGFSSWKDVESLIELVDIIVAHRDSLDRKDFPYPHTYLSNTIFPISSSDIRQKLCTGESVANLIPPEVLHYITSHNLYND